MKRLILPLIALSQSLQSQTTISGKITDNQNKALRGISISIKDTYDGATSDSSGNYSFTTTEKGAQSFTGIINRI